MNSLWDPTSSDLVLTVCMVASPGDSASVSKDCMGCDISRWWNRAAGGTVAQRQEKQLVYRIEKVATSVLVAADGLSHTYVRFYTM